MDLDGLRNALGVKTLTALDQTATRRGPGQPMSTLNVLTTLMALDVAAEWDRIWLEFGDPSRQLVSQYADPVPDSGDQWQGQPVTGTCARAIRAAVALAAGSGILPVSPGVLALCLMGEPTAAAVQAMGATSAAGHSALLELAQEALVGGSWQDIDSVLARCFAASDAESPAAGEEAELVRFAGEAVSGLADRFEELIDVLNQFLRADTAAGSGRLLQEHPELLGGQVDRIIKKSIQEAQSAGDTEGVRRLRERQSYLDHYRRLTGAPRPEAGPARHFGECPAAEHRWAGSDVSKPGYQGIAVRCERCHAGYLLEMTTAAGGATLIGYFIFPADGCDTMSTEIKMFAVGMCERFIGQMEQQGMLVNRETPVIGLRPESLAMHTDFTPFD